MLCEACSAGVVPLSRHEGMACLRCSKVFAGGVRGWGTCASCMEGRPAFDCAVAAYPARGLVREMVHRFKYEGRKELCWLLAGWMGEGLEDPRLRDPPPEVLVPVPLHWFRQWSRGFNQAELLARSLSEGLTQGRGGSAGAFPVELLLRRGRRTGTQTRLDRQGRLGNIQGAFELRRGAARRLQGRRVLLVDDVLTTGATLDACARVLLSGGAASVRALAVARG